jgi:uncharacterized protein (TIRG00374 family)
MLKNCLVLALKITLSGLLIWYLLANVDLELAKQRLFGAEKPYIAAAIALIGVQAVIGGFRWSTVLRAIGGRLPIFETIQFFYISMFFGQAMPSALGTDPIRMYMAYRGGLPLPKAINSVVLERAVTLMALVLLAAVLLPTLISKLDPANAFWVIWGMVTVVLSSIGGLVMVMFLDRLPNSMHRWNFVRGLAQLATDARRVFLTPKSLAMAMALGVLTHVNLSFCVLMLAKALSIEVTMLDCLMLMPPVLLILIIPISINGWGLRESAMVTAFGLIGVPSEAAFVLSVTLGLVSIGAVIPGGLVWLLHRRRREGLEISPP